jgi:hypothetical protein
MRLLRRERAPAPPAPGHDALDVSSVRFLDGADPRAVDDDARDVLARIVDEAVLLQGLTEDILAGIRERRSLAELAPPGGALISRFVALRIAVPEPAADPHLREQADRVREILDHHALMLSSSLDLLGDLRPDRVAEQLDRLAGLGAPARRLCTIRDELSGA